jgi:hypothetical protein
MKKEKICDIIGGNNYIFEENKISLLLFTDEVSYMKSSNHKMWAVFSSIVELPPIIRNNSDNIIFHSLLQPFNQLCNNADVDDKYLLKELYSNSGLGYDVINNELVPLNEYKVYDSTGVLIDSLSNAIAVAKSILSVECSLYNY